MPDETYTIKIVPYPHTLTEVSYTPVLSTVCGELIYQGPVHISYVPNGKLLDFKSVQAYIGSIKRTEMPVEGVAREIFNTLRAVLGDDVPLRVMVEIATPTLGTACITIIQTEDEADETA